MVQHSERFLEGKQVRNIIATCGQDVLTERG